MLKKLLMIAALLAQAGMSFAAPSLEVRTPWSMELPPNAPTVAAYFVLHNPSDTPDRLLGADSPVAGLAQLHEHVHADGLMKMQQVQAVPVPAGADVAFAPMAWHVMLLDLKDRSKLVDGEHFPLTLHFEKAGDITVQVQVRRDPPQGGHMH